jgi:hypothetical protein
MNLDKALREIKELKMQIRYLQSKILEMQDEKTRAVPPPPGRADDGVWNRTFP